MQESVRALYVPTSQGDMWICPENPSLIQVLSAGTLRLVGGKPLDAGENPGQDISRALQFLVAPGLCIKKHALIHIFTSRANPVLFQQGYNTVGADASAFRSP